MKLFLIASLSLFLSACGTTTVLKKTNVQPISIPSEIMDCDRIVVSIPNPETTKNKDVIRYIQRLQSALNECQGDTTTVRNLIDKYNNEVEIFNQENKKDE